LPGRRNSSLDGIRASPITGEVGIEMEMEEADVVATVLPRQRDRKAHQYIRPGIPSKKGC
jgi:hypothetical protein